MFYVGHGAYLDGNYSLAMYCTNQTNRALSTLPVKYLAKVLYEYTPDKRHIVIIDACFAGGAVPAFIEQDLADPVGIVRDQVREILQETDISRGSALFCSAGPKAVAKAPSDGTYTMFSGALRKVLLTGDPTFPEYLSLEDVAGLVEREILNTFRDERVRPELHTPRQDAGDIRTLRLFPNPALRKDWRYFENALQELRQQFNTHSIALQSLSSNIGVMRTSDHPGLVEKPTLDLGDRVKVLLRNPTNPDSALIYFANEVLRAGVYAEQANWSIDIKEYIPDLNAYRVRGITEYNYKNMFGDYPISFEVSYGYQPDKFPSLPPNAEVGRYIRINVGEEDLLRRVGSLQIPRDGIRQKSQMVMAPGATAVLKTEYVVLMAIGEEQRIRPQRFVNTLAFSITNHCAAVVKISVGTPNGRSDANEEFDLVFDRGYRSSPVRGIAPGEKGYSFKFLPPS